ncbi:MAG: nucleoside recognition domain-containing protein [Bacteroidota bacterium]
MLNYIWSGLIILSLIFAVVQDALDLTQNKFENGNERSVIIEWPQQADLTTRTNVQFRTADDSAQQLFSATWIPREEQVELQIPVTEQLPAHWQTIAEKKSGDSPETLMATVTNPPEQTVDGTSSVAIILPEVKFVKLRAITDAAFNMAEFAVKLAIGLIGAMALWLGLMRIAEQSGLIRVFNRLVYPVLRYLFPSIPKDHPAYSAISLNMAANVLGLGNAATPLGIKAMEELQELSDDKETATDAMCMFLAINTSSVQLLPPVTLVALMGVAVNELMISIIIATTVSTIVGILAAKWLGYRYRQKDAVSS